MFAKVSKSPLHGRGCFATRDLSQGEVVAEVEVLTFPPDDTERLFRTHLKNYLFYLKDGPTADGPFHTALAMGPVSFCNHSADANCDFAVNETAARITLTARRPVAKNEELTIDYGDYAAEIV